MVKLGVWFHGLRISDLFILLVLVWLLSIVLCLRLRLMCFRIKLTFMTLELMLLVPSIFGMSTAHISIETASLVTPPPHITDVVSRCRSSQFDGLVLQTFVVNYICFIVFCKL